MENTKTYWKIISKCKLNHNWHDIPDFKKHLHERGILLENKFENGKDLFFYKSFNKCYHVHFKWESTNTNFLNVIVYHSNELNNSKTEYSNFIPPIIHIIEDYFKLNSFRWFFIETLNQTDTKSIENFGRDLTPIDIWEYLLRTEITTSIKIPKKIFYSGPGHSEEVLYYGDKILFDNIINFWIAIQTWTYCDRIEFENINELKIIPYYPDSLGLCLPINPEEHKMMIELVTLETKINLPLKTCYKMSTEWDNQKYLFDYGDIFIVYNWYTGE